MTAPANLWRHGDFVRLWSAQTLSVAGSQITVLALPLTAILVFGASPVQVGALTATQYAAFLVIGLPAGVWVDRWPRRPILVVADLGRAVLLAAVPVAHLLDALSLWMLYPVAFATGVLTVFFDVADQSYLPSLIGRHQLVDGNAKLTASYSGAQLVGPGIGGVLVQILTAPVAILVDAVSFLGSALLVGSIQAREDRPAPEADGRRSLRAEMAAGLRYVFGDPYLRPIVLATAVANFFGIFGMIQALLALFAVGTLGMSPAGLGAVLAIANAGALLGTLLTRRLTRRLGLGPAITVALAAMAASLLLLPLATRDTAFPVLAAGLALGWFWVSVYNINQVSLRQGVTPEALLGRTNATVRFVIWGTIPLGALLGGWFGAALGVRTGLWIAVLGGLTAVLPLLLSPVRDLREVPAGAAPDLPVGATDG
jgi:predicted MFS family arabinose efflux permease